MSVKQPRTRKFMAHEPGFTIIDAMNRLFRAWFDGESCWDPWRVILKAAFALPMTKDEVAFFRTIAGDRLVWNGRRPTIAATEPRPSSSGPKLPALCCRCLTRQLTRRHLKRL